MSDSTRVPHIERAIAWFNFERTATALLFVAVAAAALLMPAQSDTWWHLRAGEELWRRGALPLRDTFSHTVDGGYWPNHEWGTQALFYGLYSLGGLRLLTAASAALTTAAWVLAWRISPGTHMRRLVLLTLGIMPSTIVWSIRPQVLTLFCVALTAWLLARRRHAWLPLLFLVWANLHGAVLLGVVMLVAAIAAEVFAGRRPTSLAAIAAMCLLATTLTPLGLSFWTELPASLARIRQYGIGEWRAPGVFVPRFLPFWIVLALLVASVALQLRAKARELLGNPLVCAALAVVPLAVTAERNISVFMMLAVPALSSTLAAWAAQPARARRERPIFNLSLATSAAVVAVGVVAYAWTTEWPRLGWRPLPEEAIASVATCPQRLYNRYDEGGYLIWFARGQKVFLDGRQDPYPPELIHEQVRVETSGDYESTFQRYGIGCAFIPSNSILARRLTDTGWQTTYRGAAWSVFVRPRI